MRHFSFRLRLPDGRVVDVDVESPLFRWRDAFSRACQIAEVEYRVAPFAHIVCVGYESSGVAAWPRRR